MRFILLIPGQMVTEVHPGSNGGNGYQLNILGTNADKFASYQRAIYDISSIPGYTNATSTKWQIFFAYKRRQVISK